MADYRILRNAQTDAVVLPRVRLCQSYWCHLVGLQFRRSLPKGEGLLFITSVESVVTSTIHMLNMFIPISVIWLDASHTVVDKTYAKPWRLAYAPQKPAKYYLEANPHILNVVEVGDVLSFEEAVE